MWLEGDMYEEHSEKSNSKNPQFFIFKLYLKRCLGIYLVASHCMTVVKLKIKVHIFQIT